MLRDIFNVQIYRCVSNSYINIHQQWLRNSWKSFDESFWRDKTKSNWNFPKEMYSVTQNSFNTIFANKKFFNTYVHNTHKRFDFYPSKIHLYTCKVLAPLRHFPRKMRFPCSPNHTNISSKKLQNQVKKSPNWFANKLLPNHIPNLSTFTPWANTFKIARIKKTVITNRTCAIFWCSV